MCSHTKLKRVSLCPQGGYECSPWRTCRRTPVCHSEDDAPVFEDDCNPSLLQSFRPSCLRSLPLQDSRFSSEADAELPWRALPFGCGLRPLLQGIRGVFGGSGKTSLKRVMHLDIIQRWGVEGRGAHSQQERVLLKAWLPLLSISPEAGAPAAPRAGAGRRGTVCAKGLSPGISRHLLTGSVCTWAGLGLRSFHVTRQLSTAVHRNTEKGADVALGSCNAARGRSYRSERW